MYKRARDCTTENCTVNNVVLSAKCQTRNLYHLLVLHYEPFIFVQIII